MAHTIIVDVLLGIVCAVVVASGTALWCVRSTYDRVHVIAPAAMLAAPLLAVALLVYEGISPLSVKGLLVAVLFWMTAPTLTHATLHAAHAFKLRGRPPMADR
jgi:multisubunit Na+/H+ antiporter MnhG subunit